MKIKKKIITLLVLSAITLILIFLAIRSEGYSTYGAPSEFGNESTTTCYIGGDIGIVNCTGYIYGQPIDGALGSAIIYSSKVDSEANVNISCTGLTCTYPDLTIRLAQTDNTIKYCTISSSSIALTDETHNVVYVDNNCAVQKTDFSTYIITDLSPGGITDIFNAMVHSGAIEILKGITIESKVNIKMRQKELALDHLIIVNGMEIIEENFPNITIGQGDYVYLRGIVNASRQNSSAGDIVEFVYRSSGVWSYDDHTGLNLTHCDDGTDLIECSLPTRYRRYFMCTVGFSDTTDNTEMHQLAASDSMNYVSLSNCLDVIANPLVFTLPDHYVYTCALTYAYCGRANDNDWTGEFIDLRETKVGSATGISESDPISVHTTGDIPLIADWDAGNYYLIALGFNGSLSAEDIDRDLPTDCPTSSCVSAWGDNLSTTTCSSYQPPLINSSNITCIGNQCYYNGTTGETDTTVNNTGFVNIETMNTSTTCINNTCISDWDEVNISGNGGGVTGLDTAYDGGENVIDVDTDDVVWNLTSTQDFIVQDNGVDAIIMDDSGDLELIYPSQIKLHADGAVGETDAALYILKTVGNARPIFIDTLQNSGMGIEVKHGANERVRIIDIGSTTDLLILMDAYRSGIQFNMVSDTKPMIEFKKSGQSTWNLQRSGSDISFGPNSATQNTYSLTNSGAGGLKVNISGGYGSTGVTIYDNGNISMNGNLVIDGTCESEGADCNADIAELTHSKASADNTTCNIIERHNETIIHNYYNITEEKCNYQSKGEYYELVCINHSIKAGFINISEICEDIYKEIGDNIWEKVVVCRNETPTWTEEETITISRKVECSLNPNFELEFESGDVVCIDKEDPNHIKFCDKQYDTSVVGVINYGATLIINQRAPYPLSLAGNIPVKVICNTPIEIGDLLVSSNIEGYAQSYKSWIPSKPTNLDEAWELIKKVWNYEGSVFAKALENCNSGSKTIRAWI